MSEEDIQALWAYLQSQEPVKGVERPKELNPNYKFPGLIVFGDCWNLKKGTFEEDPSVSKKSIVVSISYKLLDIVISVTLLETHLENWLMNTIWLVEMVGKSEIH